MIENQHCETREHLHKAIQLAQNAGLTQPLCVESLNHLQVFEFALQEGSQDEEFGKWIAAARKLDKTRKQLSDKKTEMQPKRRPTVQIDTLGKSRVLVNGEIVTWRAKQAKELFFYLLTHPGGQTKDEIGAALWPDHSQAKLFSIFRSSLFRLRKALFAEVVLFEEDRYRLNPEISYQYDTQAFERTFERAMLADNPTQKAYLYRHAVSLYQGEFLADLYADWTLHFREALQARYLQALAFLAQFSLDNRNYTRAIELAHQIMATDSYHETAYHVLIKAFAKSGQRPRAKQIYDRYKEMLAEFDLEPEQSWGELTQ
jgi:two-component SAPR family response regulator